MNILFDKNWANEWAKSMTKETENISRIVSDLNILYVSETLAGKQ